MRIVLVGEAPQVPLGRPGEALAGRIGKKLATLAGISCFAYLRRTTRLNVYSDPPRLWRRATARGRASAITAQLAPGTRVILLGDKVADAFEASALPLMEWQLHRDLVVARLPHPSGRNRWWNDPEHTARAAAFLRHAMAYRDKTPSAKAVDAFTSNVESLLTAILQRDLSGEQLDRLALIMQRAERGLLMKRRRMNGRQKKQGG